jgi:Zn-dependent protease
LESLAVKAQAAANGADLNSARDHWARSLELLPPDTVQYRSIQERIRTLDDQIRTSEPHSRKGWRRGAGVLGPIALALWKLKALLLGLTKLTTLLTMFVSFGFYWNLYGWRLAAGLIISIYIHEMGHVLELKKFGIPAGAPMFVPGFGAFIQLRGISLPAIPDARIGLAGPIYGLGAAMLSLIVFYATGSNIWAVIAYFGAIINLFNLIPIWQLDGGRGFHSLTRLQRAILVVISGALWLGSSLGMLLLVMLGAAYRSFRKDSAITADRIGFAQFSGLLVALTVVAFLAKRS